MARSSVKAVFQPTVEQLSNSYKAKAKSTIDEIKQKNQTQKETIELIVSTTIAKLQQDFLEVAAKTEEADREIAKTRADIEQENVIVSKQIAAIREKSVAIEKVQASIKRAENQIEKFLKTDPGKLVSLLDSIQSYDGFSDLVAKTKSIEKRVDANIKDIQTLEVVSGAQSLRHILQIGVSVKPDGWCRVILIAGESPFYSTLVDDNRLTDLCLLPKGKYPIYVAYSGVDFSISTQYKANGETVFWQLDPTEATVPIEYTSLKKVAKPMFVVDVD